MKVLSLFGGIAYEGEKSPTLTGSFEDNSKLVAVQDYEFIWRKLTPIECERLQTLPDDYTKCVSASRRYKAIGNGWTVATIQHIFSYIPGWISSNSPAEPTQESTGSSLSSPKSGSQNTGHEEE